ncbi:MAG: hypothetical protein WC750_01820 [Patescibacteria group bacterium]|jgi:hypothetical protein
MQIIKPVFFAAYAFVGLIVAAIATAIYGAVMWGQPNPAYPAYKKMQDDYSAEVKNIDSVKMAKDKAGITRPFQEVLLGGKPTDSLRSPEVSQLASTLRSVQSSETPDGLGFAKLTSDLPWLMNKDCLHVVGYRKEGDYEITRIDNFWYACRTAEYELFRTEPFRVARLLQGDRTALTPLPEVPEMAAQLAGFPQIKPEPETLSVKWTRLHYLRLWLAFSVVFALAYSFMGALICKKPDEHPLKAIPGFLLGWIIILATLPGFLAAYSIGLVWMILSSNPAAAIKKMNAKRADARKLSLGGKLITTLKAHQEVNGYRDPGVRVTLEHENLRRALASNILPESMKDEVEEYLELDGLPSEQTAATEQSS